MFCMKFASTFYNRVGGASVPRFKFISLALCCRLFSTNISTRILTPGQDQENGKRTVLITTQVLQD